MKLGDDARRETQMAWAATLLSAFYYLWVGVVTYQGLPMVSKMQEALGVTDPLPKPYPFLSDHPWVSLAAAVTLSAVLILKEARMSDKRRSIMITSLVAVICLILVDVMKTLMMRPLFLLTEKLLS